MSRVIKILTLVAILATIPARAWAIPTADGFWTKANADGYTLFLESYNTVGAGANNGTDFGVLGLAIDGSFLYVMFAQPTSVNDNSWGTFRQGWSGTDHGAFGIEQLTDSEAATFVIGSQFNRNVDYINCNTSSDMCDTAGNLATTGTGSLTGASLHSSLQWNLGSTPTNCGEASNGKYFTDSPNPGSATNYDNNETVSGSPCNVAGADWLFPTIWELKISLASLGAQFTGVTDVNAIRSLVNVTDVNNSPAKGASVGATACSDAHFSSLAISGCGPAAVPEPASLMLVGSGTLVLVAVLRRRKTA